MKDIDYLTEGQFESLNTGAVEIIKLITAILKTAKANNTPKSLNIYHYK
jgi:hypothetical protein